MQMEHPGLISSWRSLGPCQHKTPPSVCGQRRHIMHSNKWKQQWKCHNGPQLMKHRTFTRTSVSFSRTLRTFLMTPSAQLNNLLKDFQNLLSGPSVGSLQMTNKNGCISYPVVWDVLLWIWSRSLVFRELKGERILNQSSAKGSENDGPQQS